MKIDGMEDLNEADEINRKREAEEQEKRDEEYKRNCITVDEFDWNEFDSRQEIEDRYLSADLFDPVERDTDTRRRIEDWNESEEDEYRENCEDADEYDWKVYELEKNEAYKKDVEAGWESDAGRLHEAAGLQEEKSKEGVSAEARVQEKETFGFHEDTTLNQLKETERDLEMSAEDEEPWL